MCGNTVAVTCLENCFTKSRESLVNQEYRIWIAPNSTTRTDDDDDDDDDFAHVTRILDLLNSKWTINDWLTLMKSLSMSCFVYHCSYNSPNPWESKRQIYKHLNLVNLHVVKRNQFS